MTVSNPSDEVGTTGEFGYLDPRVHELFIYFTNSRDNILRLREYLPVLIKSCDKSDKESARLIADRSYAAKALDVSTRDRIQQLVDMAYVRFEENANFIQVDDNEALAISDSEIFDDPIPSFLKIFDMTPLVASASKFIPEMLVMPPRNTSELAYFYEILSVTQRLSGLQRLLRTQYMVAISQIQPMLSALFLLVLRRINDGAPEKRTRAELDSKVRNLLKQAPKKWMEKLQEVFEEEILKKAIDWDELDRIWNRRNLFMHRGGLVDTSFKEQEPDSPLVVGAPVELFAKDVYEAFDFAGGITMGFLLMTANLYFPGLASGFANEQGSKVVLEDLDKQRWWLAEGTARALLAFVESPHEYATRVNYWLARSSRLGLSAIEDEVSAWDTSDLESIYKLAKLVLLQHDAEALELIDLMRSNRELRESDWATWPLFSRFRLDTPQ